MKLKEVLKTSGKSGRIKIERKSVPIDKLDSMLNYQRDIDMAFVEEKSRDDVFRESEVSVVLVSVRPDGSMKVCDGQHTIAILKRRGYTMVQCELRYGLTEQEENDWFNIENTKRRGQSRKRTLTAQINGTYENNKDEQDFNNCVKSLGFKLDIYGEESGNDFRIGCPAKLLGIYKEYISNEKKEEFIECLDIVKSCFNGDPVSLHWSFLRGMFDFYETYLDKFDRKRLIEVLSRENIRDIKKDAESDIRTKKTSMKYAKLFVEKYNYKLPKKNQLKMSKLDDQVGDNLPNYVKIPREIIYNKELGDKRVIIFSYLCSRRTLDDTVAFSISELCHWSHLKPNYHDGKINHKYLEVLELLSHYDYLKSYPDFEKLAKEKKNSTDYYNIQINTKKFDIPDNFGIIYFDELEKILNFKEELKGVKINDEEIDLLRMSSAYILLLLSYLRVNMNRNPDKPLCCYRLYQKITEDIGLSERYISRIVEMLDVMDIIKFQEGKRIRYKKQDDKYGFLTTPKVFADYMHFTKDEKGNQAIDSNYDYRIEIQKQLDILEESQKKMQKYIVDITMSTQIFQSKGESSCILH